MISLQKEWKQQQRSYHDVCLEFFKRKEKKETLKDPPFFLKCSKHSFRLNTFSKKTFKEKNTSVDNWMNINLEYAMILKFKIIAITCLCKFNSAPNEIISEADSRVFDAIRQMLTSLNRCALWNQKKENSWRAFIELLSKLFFFSLSSSIFFCFSAYSVLDRWCSLRKSNARIKDNVPENHLFCAIECDCVAIPQSINLQITANCVRGILKMRTVLLLWINDL